jgi:hypothetical protein
MRAVSMIPFDKAVSGLRYYILIKNFFLLPSAIIVSVLSEIYRKVEKLIR